MLIPCCRWCSALSHSCFSAPFMGAEKQLWWGMSLQAANNFILQGFAQAAVPPAEIQCCSSQAAVVREGNAGDAAAAIVALTWDETA